METFSQYYLLKNWFCNAVFNQLDDYTFDNDEMEITQDWDDQTVYYITTHANEYTVSGHRIEYLHQLQNAYFCLSGGKELEVNL